MESKPLYLSKTLWTNVIIAICAMFVPGVAAWIQANPEMVVSIFAGINILLRLITKNGVALWLVPFAFLSLTACGFSGCGGP